MLNFSRLIVIGSMAFLLPQSLYAETFSFAFQQRAQAYYSAGRYLEALSFYQECLKNSDSAEQKAIAFFGLGLLFDRYLDIPEQALSYYKSHIELLGENSAKALHYSAKILTRQSRFEEARGYYHMLLQKHAAYSKVHSIQRELETCMGGAVTNPGRFGHDALKSLSGTVRVLIKDTSDSVVIKGSPGLRVALNGQKNNFKPYDDVLVINADNCSLLVNNVPWPHEELVVQGDDGDYLKVNGRRYRSFVSVRAKQGRLQLINHVQLDHYLYGVLPREVYVSWPMAVLQAQAVAARTYVLYHMLVNKNRSYDVLSTTSSQVYGGFEREHPATNMAVDTTHAQVLFIDRQLALTLYHANSGGVVESIEDVWGARLSHLRRVVDTPSLKGRHVSWSCTLSNSELVKRLADYGILYRDFEKIEVVKRSAGGRVQRAVLKGQGTSLQVGGNSLRLMLGPSAVKSTRFIVEQSEGQFTFNGTGYGHGVGMSQWGACELAKKGIDYSSILAHYYPETKLAPWDAGGQGMVECLDDAL